MKDMAEKANKISLEQIREKYNIYHSFRAYLDSGSSQFEGVEYPEKLNTLGRLVYFGEDLQQLIVAYKIHYKGEGYDHVRANLKLTFISLLSWLKHGSSLDYQVQKEMEDKSEVDVIKSFQTELSSTFIPNFNLDLYIISVARSKTAGLLPETDPLHHFFGVNFKKIPDSIFERDENLPFERHYKHLYNFLNRILYKAYVDNDITHLYPQLGMDLNTQQLLQKHLPLSKHPLLIEDPDHRKETIFNLLKDVFQIVYFGKEITLE